MSRLHTLQELSHLRSLQRGCVGLATGVFDLLHFGHERFLTICRSQCDTLLLGVDADAIVTKKKGLSRPLQRIEVRVRALVEKNLADAVFIKHQSGDELLVSLRPNKYFVSANRTIPRERIALIEGIGASLIAIPYTFGISTSTVIADSDAG